MREDTEKTRAVDSGLTIPDFDLELEDIPVLEPSKVFMIWVWIFNIAIVLLALGTCIGLGFFVRWLLS